MKAKTWTHASRQLLMMLVFITGCASPKVPVDEISFGVSCRECQGECVQGFRQVSGQVYRIAATDYHLLEKTTGMEAAPEEAAKARSVIAVLPDQLDLYREPAGCPDCADQCAIFVSRVLHGRRTTLWIDPKHHHSRLDAFVDQVMAMQLL